MIPSTAASPAGEGVEEHTKLEAPSRAGTERQSRSGQRVKRLGQHVEIGLVMELILLTQVP